MGEGIRITRAPLEHGTAALVAALMKRLGVAKVTLDGSELADVEVMASYDFHGDTITLGGVAVTTLEEAVTKRGVTPRDPEYWRLLRMTKAESEGLAAQANGHPEPEHTSRDPWPDAVDVPQGFKVLENSAKASGWVTDRTYSRGWTTHATTGKPSKFGERIALRCFHPESRARAIVFYFRNPVTGKSEHESTFIVPAGGPPYVGCNVAESKEFLLMAGRVMPGWIQAVKARSLAQTERARAGAKGRSTRKEGMS